MGNIKINTRKSLFIASLIYVAFLIILVTIDITVVPSFRNAGNISQGCHIGNAMIVGIECKGFIGHSIVSFILNIPYLLIYLYIFGVSKLSYSPMLILLAIFISPMGYILFYLLKPKSNKQDMNIPH